MLGLNLLMYAKVDLIGHIRDVDHDSVKCGFANKIGDVGAVVLKF